MIYPSVLLISTKEEPPDVKFSKFLSYICRHGAERRGLQVHDGTTSSFPDYYVPKMGGEESGNETIRPYLKNSVSTHQGIPPCYQMTSSLIPRPSSCDHFFCREEPSLAGVHFFCWLGRSWGLLGGPRETIKPISTKHTSCSVAYKNSPFHCKIKQFSHTHPPAGGYVDVSAILGLEQDRRHTEEDVRRAVANCPKQRFALREEPSSGLQIRANQGHTIEVNLVATSRPEFLLETVR